MGGPGEEAGGVGGAEGMDEGDGRGRQEGGGGQGEGDVPPAGPAVGPKQGRGLGV